MGCCSSPGEQKVLKNVRKESYTANREDSSPSSLPSNT